MYAMLISRNTASMHGNSALHSRVTCRREPERDGNGLASSSDSLLVPPNHAAARHHEARTLEHHDVAKWIAIDGDEVGQHTACDQP